MTRLVLGSASTGRLAVLRAAGVNPVVIVSGVDEDAIIAGLGPTAPAERVVVELAAAKARAVAESLPADIAADAVIIGCDSMLQVADRLCGKPGSAEAALQQWQLVAGGSGQLHTGHCAVRVQDGAVTATESETRSTTVHFANPAPADLDAYIATGEPIGVAGGFTLDGLGGWFIDRIEGDPSNVIGVSLPLLRTLLARLGLPIAPFWE